MKLLLLSLAFSAFSTYATEESVSKIYSFAAKEMISYEDFAKKASSESHFVLGEYHSSPAIQKAQSEFIERTVTLFEKTNDFSVGWEFLEYANQIHSEQVFSKIEELDANTFFKELLSPKNTDYYMPYYPILTVTKVLGGELIALNEKREIKQIIVKEGMDKLPSQYLPPNYKIGSKSYLERFKKAMGNHTPDEMIMPYFEAQCFTDSVMAYQFIKNATRTLRYTVVGSFHSDYKDGYVRELKRISNEQPIVTLKFVKRSDYNEKSWNELIGDGAISDYLIIAP